MRHSRMNPRLPVLALSALLLVPVGLTAQTGDMNRLPDETIQSIVEHRLSSRDLDGKVDVRVNDGTVELTGTVDTLAEKNQAERLVRKLEDVRMVDNQLKLNGSDMGQDEIAQKVGQTIRQDPMYSIFDWVEGRFQNGRLLLTGYVTAPWKKEDFAERAQRVPGVEAVENAIEVLPVGDTDLRVSLARQIYGDLLFQRYAFGSNPPIHIIVKNGRVTLEGVVDSQVHKRVASSIVRSDYRTFGVDNNLTVGS